MVESEEEEEEDDTDCDALIEDSQNMDDAAGLLGDPKALSTKLREQYESV